MDERVGTLLNGRGHPTVFARAVGLADAADEDLVEYALHSELVVVTFDADLRNRVLRQASRCLFIRGPERTARERVREYYDEVTALLWEGHPLVTIPRSGVPRADKGR